MKLKPEILKLAIKETIAIAKNNGSTYKLKQDDPTLAHLTGICKKCKSEITQHHAYFRKCSCWCQRQKKINKVVREKALDKFFSGIKSRKIKMLEEFRAFNVKSPFKCLVCKNKWESYVNNISKGSGCPECSRRRKLGKSPSKKSRQRFYKTMMEKYGVLHAQQHKEFFDKSRISGYRHYDYKLGRKIIRVQGYEPFALDYLIKIEKIKPSNILAGRGSDIPSIKYARNKIYHPDIYIPSENLLIEVKSWYTYKCAIRINNKKAEAARKRGYNFKFLVFNRDGTLRETKNDGSERKRNPNFESRAKDRRRKSSCI